MTCYPDREASRLRRQVVLIESVVKNGRLLVIERAAWTTGIRRFMPSMIDQAVPLGKQRDAQDGAIISRLRRQVSLRGSMGFGTSDE